MPVTIPELQGYFGGKAGSGTYQNIINVIPPHNYLVVPFLGNGGIVRNIRPADKKTVLNDIDGHVVDSWMRAHARDFTFRWRDHGSTRVDEMGFFNFDALDILDIGIFDRPDVVIYLDPPYPWWTRKSKHRYRYEYSAKQHFDLLVRIKAFKHAKVIISTYKNLLYDIMLDGWSTKSFRSTTRKGSAVESVYYNYDRPTLLHDYRYFGDGSRKREKLKIKKEAFVRKYMDMEEAERNYLFMALKEEMDGLLPKGAIERNMELAQQEIDVDGDLGLKLFKKQEEDFLKTMAKIAYDNNVLEEHQKRGHGLAATPKKVSWANDTEKGGNAQNEGQWPC